MAAELTPEKLAELREYSRLATPGPWHLGIEPSEGRENDTSWNDSTVFAELDGRYLLVAESHHLDNDAQYIAAADPKTVAAMVDEILRLRIMNKTVLKIAKQVGHALERYRVIAKQPPPIDSHEAWRMLRDCVKECVEAVQSGAKEGDAALTAAGLSPIDEEDQQEID